MKLKRNIHLMRSSVGEKEPEIVIKQGKIIEFGRYACQQARKQGMKCATFDFLGFTHFCDKTKSGNFKVGRKT